MEQSGNQEDRQLLVKELLSKTPSFEAASVGKLEHLAGDASQRKYYRVYLDEAPLPTVVLMILSHQKGPLTYGGESFNQDDTFVELAGYLKERGLNVPRVLCDGRELGALLVESSSGQRFRIGTGFTHAERKHPPPVGSIVTYKYHGLTVNGLPRFPSYLRVRSDGL